MEAFGQLAGGVAHDFNNFLTTILGYSDLVVAEVEGRGSVAKYISEIRGAAGRAASLTQQLLAFSRAATARAACDRGQWTHQQSGALDSAAARGKHLGVLRIIAGEKTAYIKIDPNQFTQIIVNLAVNARDAMSVGGTLTLRTSELNVADATSQQLDPELQPGRYVVISVIDNGCGMSEEVKAHLFEPFFTTKSEHQGSGLGLAACYGIIRQSSGHIGLESAPGKGTAVHIYLPEVSAPESGNYRKPRASHVPGGSETILMLEDDIIVRHVMTRTLRRLGYDVIEAVRSDEARQRMSERPVDLVVTDIVLPDESGRDFARWTRRHYPQTRIILISGYLSSGEGERNEHIFLSKPFDPEQFARAVRETLDSHLAV